MAYERGAAQLQALLDRSPSARRYYSDRYEGYANLVYDPGRHTALPNKSQTHAVEADNAELRHDLARLGRRSHCFTRSLRALRDAPKLFIYARNRSHSPFQCILVTEGWSENDGMFWHESYDLVPPPRRRTHYHEIVDLLRESHHALSGAEIAAAIKYSIANTNMALSRLFRAGYLIRAEQKTGNT